jgi:hypothetical protein
LRKIKKLRATVKEEQSAMTIYSAVHEICDGDFFTEKS